MEAPLLPMGPPTANDGVKEQGTGVWAPARLAKRLFEEEGTCQPKPEAGRSRPSQQPGQ